MYYTLLFLFILSRFFFINTGNVFFDSGENLGLFAYQNFFQAIVSGHFPPHEGYIVLFWPVFQIMNYLSFYPTYSVILGQILLATATIICFYKVISFITDNRTALFASIIVSLTPLFWITNVTIMMEIVYISFFFFALYFFINYLSLTKKTIFLHLSAICLTFSFLTHMLIVLWFPLFLIITFYKRKKLLIKILLTFGVYLSLASILNILFIAAVSKETITAVFHHLYLIKGNEFAYLPMNVHGFFISMRNFLIPLFRGNTSLIVVIYFLSMLYLFINDKKIFLFGLLWIIPTLYTNQWWDSLLNGRHSLMASFGLAFIVAYMVRKHTTYALLIIIYLIFVSVPILQLLNSSIPYLQEMEAIKSLPKEGLFIESHFARPQVQNIRSQKFFYVNEPGYNTTTLMREINFHLEKKKPVFISSAALSEPYGLYSGPYLHNITLSYAKPFELKSKISKYTLTLYKIINKEDNLLIYQIVSATPSPYPQIQSLKNSSRRLDYYDPIARLLWIQN